MQFIDRSQKAYKESALSLYGCPPPTAVDDESLAGTLTAAESCADLRAISGLTGGGGGGGGVGRAVRGASDASGGGGGGGEVADVEEARRWLLLDHAAAGSRRGQ